MVAKKIVILFSGGMDSVLLQHYAKVKYPLDEIICVYYKHGAVYEEYEVANLSGDCHVKTIEWLDENNGPVIKKDQPQYGSIFIPGRNLLFAVAAACQFLPDEIWLGALADEDIEASTDKNLTFLEKTSDTLSYVLRGFVDDKVTLRFPFVEEGWSKDLALKWALENNIDPQEVLDTVTCHVHDGKGCGKCIPCLKRYLSFKLNGLDETYHHEPIKSEYGRENLKKYLLNVPENKNEQYVVDIIHLAFETEGVLDHEEAEIIRNIIDGK